MKVLLPILFLAATSCGKDIYFTKEGAKGDTGEAGQSCEIEGNKVVCGDKAIAIEPGKDGRDGLDGVGLPGVDGVDGKDAPFIVVGHQATYTESGENKTSSFNLTCMLNHPSGAVTLRIRTKTAGLYAFERYGRGFDYVTLRANKEYLAYAKGPGTFKVKFPGGITKVKHCH